MQEDCTIRTCVPRLCSLPACVVHKYTAATDSSSPPGNMEPEQQEALADEVTVETQKVVKYGEKKWIPQQVEEQGVNWILLNKWDRHLVLFVHGKPLDLSRQKKSDASVDCPWFDQLLEHRQRIFNQKVEELLAAEGDEEPPAKKAKKDKTFKATKAHRAIAPHHIMMELPEVKGAPVLSCRVLFEGIGATGIWVELLPEVLMYIRLGLKESEAKPRKVRSTKAR